MVSTIAPWTGAILAPTTKGRLQNKLFTNSQGIRFYYRNVTEDENWLYLWNLDIKMWLNWGLWWKYFVKSMAFEHEVHCVFNGIWRRCVIWVCSTLSHCECWCIYPQLQQGHDILKARYSIIFHKTHSYFLDDKAWTYAQLNQPKAFQELGLIEVSKYFQSPYTAHKLHHRLPIVVVDWLYVWPVIQ